MSDYEDSDDKKSLFNAGILMTQRLDSLQRAINSARFNLEARNVEVGKFNYEVILAANDGLLSECWSKLNPDEKKLGQRYKSIVHEYLKYHPIMVVKKGELNINTSHLEGFKERFDDYEKMVKMFLESHDLNNPSKDRDSDEL